MSIRNGTQSLTTDNRYPRFAFLSARALLLKLKILIKAILRL